jgi:hypothetical protein
VVVPAHLLLGGLDRGEPIGWHLALLLPTDSTGRCRICIGLETRILLGRSTQQSFDIVRV